MVIKTLEEYIESYGDALAQNPPFKSPAYADDPVGVWRYAMRVFGAGLADWHQEEVGKITGTLYGKWFVRLETFGPNRARVDAKEFIGWIRSAEFEERERRKKMNESQLRLARFIMEHFPDEYEKALDEGKSICDVAMEIIMRLSQRLQNNVQQSNEG
jgi:hypothetical protein